MKEKRKARAYKITDKHYERALKKASKTDKSLAERIEEFVIEYGAPVKRVKVNGRVSLPSDYIDFSKGIGILNVEGSVLKSV